MMSYSYQNKFFRLIAYCIDMLGRVFLKKRSLPSISPRAILVVKLDHLGDCFLMTPLFESLHRKFPSARIDVVCLESSVPIFEHNPYIHKIIPFNKKHATRSPQLPASWIDSIRLVKLLRRNQYDVCVDPRGDFTAARIGFFSGAKYRVGFEGEEVGGFLYTTRLRYDRSTHETERYKTILTHFGVAAVEWVPRLYPDKEEISFVEEKLGLIKKPIAILHIGAGVAYKIWPIERWAEVISFLQKRDFEIICVGAKDDNSRVETVRSLLSSGIVVHDFAGMFSIRETYHLISKGSLFIGNDSVLGHFSGALGVPTIVLMNSGVSQDRWRPLGSRVTVLVGRNLRHRCTYDACLYPCPHMEQIVASRVCIAIKNLIG